ncbi:MAG: ABC transporter [Parcubacteria group bacterium CG1_02_41_12]|nr:MAG: ABC transporter [Parcubacteria group bacterium CG1_02_41_12]
MNLKPIQSSINNIKPIFKREFVSFFNSPIAYIFVAVFLVVTNWLFFTRFFLTGQANMREWFGLVPWLFLLLAPAITMRSWAEEKKSGTVEFLLTLPIRDWEVVIAKFLSSLSFLAVVLIFSLTIPITIGKLGDIDFGVIISGYVGAILMGAMYLSLGLLISSFTKNQIVSFLISLSVLFAIFIIGSNNVMSFLQGPLASIMQFLSSATHFNSIVKGIFDSRDIIYYLSFTALFIYLNIQTIGSRNWR